MLSLWSRSTINILLINHGVRFEEADKERFDLLSQCFFIDLYKGTCLDDWRPKQELLTVIADSLFNVRTLPT
jgi:hypothetical protein